MLNVILLCVGLTCAQPMDEPYNQVSGGELDPVQFVELMSEEEQAEAYEELADYLVCQEYGLSC